MTQGYKLGHNDGALSLVSKQHCFRRCSQEIYWVGEWGRGGGNITIFVTSSSQ